MNNLMNLCCGDEGLSTLKEYCKGAFDVDDAIAAIAIIENAPIPSVGDTIELSTEVDPVVLTRDNYAESLLQWVRDRQFDCTGGGDIYHFFHNGLLEKGTRTKPTTILSETVNIYSSPEKIRQEATVELMFGQQYLPNIGSINGIQDRAATLSVIYFFKQGAVVKDANDDSNIYITDAGFEVTGEKNKFVSGSISLMDSSKKDDFFFVSSPNSFLKELKKATKFTFGNATVTGIAAKACGSKGSCKVYSILEQAAFTYTPVVNELTSCATFALYKDCGDALPTGLASKISIDSASGVVTASAGLDPGTYKFTIEVTNECGISGTQCFIIEVAVD